MSLLLSPLTIRSINFRNRIVVSPMCQYSSIDGFVNDWHLVHLGARAVGGAALVMTEANAVSPEGRISPADIGIWSDDHIPGLKRIVDFIHQQGSIAGTQLAHAGRKASHREPWKGGAFIPQSEGGWKTVAPSAIPFIPANELPESLSKEGIQKVINDFVAAAKRSLQCGFRVVEIHAAHGYLLHQFYSPFSNHRTDEYGGSFENRIRLTMEVCGAVREVWPNELPLFIRVSATDWTEGGWTVDDTAELAKRLKPAGVDLVDCSSGANIPHVKIPAEPGYQVPFAEAVKRRAGLLSGAVGFISTPEQAEKILEEGKADMIFLAREFLRNPNFPLWAAHQLGDEIEWPVQYLRAEFRKR
ncbi:MAG TPA: NADH:flavin oxidoreductase/NADH oxidase [Flavitalea sp.]|nr:NADH:flavin oxidoreductase/NADH oxidase [Flavitalea sp.]